MYNIELRIKPADWFYILIIGITLGGVLAAFFYMLLTLSWVDGALLGALLGFTITLFSMLFISIMNQSILPKISKRLWLPFAVFFSFISGFLGTETTLIFSNIINLEMIPFFKTHTLQLSIFVGFLTYIVGVLLYRFVKMRNEKEQIDRHYLQSRLRSLEKQLNPHFLFNSLNSIAELIHQDPYKAEEAILKVSSFLRNTMNEKALVSLNEELKNVQAYIDVENIRFGGQVTVESPSALPRVEVPKFSLQLIAENAIKHGMVAGKPLHITVQFLEEEHAITIENNGMPITNPSFGIGLKNLDERLKLLCKGKLQVVETSKPMYKLYLGECHENIDR